MKKTKKNYACFRFSKIFMIIVLWLKMFNGFFHVIFLMIMGFFKCNCCYVGSGFTCMLLPFTKKCGQ
jgi:hypothetical protein